MVKKDLNSIDKALLDCYGFTLRKNQIKACNYLSKGFIVELSTGEGKSVVSLVTSILLSQEYKRVYIVSINDYLSRRDYEKFKPIYDKFNLSCSLNISSTKKSDKCLVHNSDIVFTNSTTLAFDYLNSKIGGYSFNLELDCCIVDECDYVLLDNATSEFSISFNSEKHNTLSLIKYKFLYNSIINSEMNVLMVDKYVDKIDCSRYHCVLYVNEKKSKITELGIEFLSQLLNIDIDKVLELYNIFTSCLEAKFLYTRGKDYDILDNKVVPINLGNGRLSINSRFANNVHLFLEIKENLTVNEISLGNFSVSYQTLFAEFRFLCGMSGTLSNTSEEIEYIFNKRIKKVSSFFRKNYSYERHNILKTKIDKYKYLIDRVNECSYGSILIITDSNNETDIVYSMLIDSGLNNKFKVTKLNYFNSFDEENLIIDSVSDANTITVCSYLCSRGTDIKVGQNGFLNLFCLNNFQNTRIDKQVIGRCCRNGENGGYHFITSLEDDVWNHSSYKFHSKLMKLSKRLLCLSFIQIVLNLYRIFIQNKIYRSSSCDRMFLFDIYNFYNIQLNSILSFLLDPSDDNCRESLLYNINMYLKDLFVNGSDLYDDDGCCVFGLLVDKYNSKKVRTFLYKLINNYVYSCDLNELKSSIYSYIFKNFTLFKNETANLIKVVPPKNIFSTNRFMISNKELYEKSLRCMLYDFCEYVISLYELGCLNEDSEVV